jgi:hypothetical protein
LYAASAYYFSKMVILVRVSFNYWSLDHFLDLTDWLTNSIQQRHLIRKRLPFIEPKYLVLFSWEALYCILFCDMTWIFRLKICSVGLELMCVIKVICALYQRSEIIWQNVCSKGSPKHFKWLHNSYILSSCCSTSLKRKRVLSEQNVNLFVILIGQS